MLKYVIFLYIIDVIGNVGRCLYEFYDVGSVLLRSYELHHQKDGLGDAVHHGNDSRWISERRSQYLHGRGMWRQLLSDARCS